MNEYYSALILECVETTLNKIVNYQYLFASTCLFARSNIKLYLCIVYEDELVNLVN